jgi:hypothetical protein
MPDDWNTYRTRFLVRAKQLTEPLNFTDPLGREHNGHPGDYLVQSSEGLLRIAPREIFEDIYVPLKHAERSSQHCHSPVQTSEVQASQHLRV